MMQFRVYDEAERAMQEHKWLLSEKAGHDLGIEAERDWIEHYWRRFCRSRFVRHLRGETFFEEFGPECFGVGYSRLAALRELLDTILELVQEGAENLDLIRWAGERRLPREQVLEVLTVVDINRRRLLPPIR